MRSTPLRNRGIALSASATDARLARGRSAARRAAPELSSVCSSSSRDPPTVYGHDHCADVYGCGEHEKPIGAIAYRDSDTVARSIANRLRSDAARESTAAKNSGERPSFVVVNKECCVATTGTPQHSRSRWPALWKAHDGPRRGILYCVVPVR